jgi:large subunit ribosomal protein L21
MSATTNKMFAVIKTGGKQYRVAVGDVIDVELLHSDPGANVTFQEVLFASDGAKAQLGQPHIANFFVYAEVLEMVSGEKITTLKYKASHNQCRKWGHRQKYTRVKITGIGSQQQSKEE